MVLPSQTAPHVVPAPVPPHAGRELCGVPATGEQVPTRPPMSHAWHWPPHDESQHTPSTQKPEPHSAAEPQAVPFALLHLPGEPGRLQEKPAPAHAVSQQTPLTQLPVWHDDALVQVLPFPAFTWQEPPAQK
jgi:hypothetical protein